MFSITTITDIIGFEVMTSDSCDDYSYIINIKILGINFYVSPKGNVMFVKLNKGHKV